MGAKKCVLRCSSTHEAACSPAPVNAHRPLTTHCHPPTCFCSRIASTCGHPCTCTTNSTKEPTLSPTNLLLLQHVHELQVLVVQVLQGLRGDSNSNLNSKSLGVGKKKAALYMAQRPLADDGSRPSTTVLLPLPEHAVGC